MADVTSLLRLLDAGEITDRQRHIERQKIEALLGYCETVSCRRQVLLGYFGETDHPPCGNCDNCRTPVPSWDGTIAAQKALSAVYRTGQRFGMRHLVDLLLGVETERILRLGHNRLKTFGVGTEIDRRGWLSVFRQLVAQGFALPDIAGHGGLSLGPGAAEILRGTKAVRFRLDTCNPKGQGPRDRKAGAGAHAVELDPAARALWDTLRAWRLDEARRQGLPPYVIFHDSTLTEVARRRPVSLEALAQIPGVGRSKLERYGSEVVAIVAESRAHRSESAPADSQDARSTGKTAPTEPGAEKGMPS
jgi:ATP-dependent DNA helicase RecQ